MTVAMTPFSYVDVHGVEISVRSWIPDAPRGAVQIAHGIGEHSGRYERFAQALAAAGFAVYADDHRGHGHTGERQWEGNLDRLGKLGPGGLRATEDAIVQLTGLIRDAQPGLRVGMFAHSWGSLMAQRIIQRVERPWDAIVLSGSAYRTPRFMESGALNRRWESPTASGFEWLSSDESVGQRFRDDPFNFQANIPALFGLADAARLLGVPKPGVATDVPMLIVSGGDDPLTKRDGLDRLRDAYQRAGVRQVTLRTYPGLRHELLNEVGASDIHTWLATWFTEQLGGDDVS